MLELHNALLLSHIYHRVELLLLLLRREDAMELWTFFL